MPLIFHFFPCQFFMCACKLVNQVCLMVKELDRVPFFKKTKKKPSLERNSLMVLSSIMKCKAFSPLRHDDWAESLAYIQFEGSRFESKTK